MFPRLMISLLAVLFTLGFAVSHASAVELGQIDDFENGRTMNWREGLPSPNPPTNMPDGGPDGAGDNFLSNHSSGGFGPGSRWVMINSVQWSGNYVSAGVGGIQMFIQNTGNTPVLMRIAIDGAGSRHGSLTAIEVPNDGEWHDVYFGMAPDELGLISGATTAEEALAAVNILRLMVASGGPDWLGDSLVAWIGVDDIRAVSGPPVSVDDASWGGLKGDYGEE